MFIPLSVPEMFVVLINMLRCPLIRHLGGAVRLHIHVGANTDEISGGI